MNGRPWLRALKTTVRKQGTGTYKPSEKISEGCERCESPADAPTPDDGFQAFEKVRGSWGKEGCGLIAAGWKPKERGVLVIWANPETGFYYSQEVALRHLEASEGASHGTFATQKARASWTLGNVSNGRSKSP